MAEATSSKNRQRKSYTRDLEFKLIWLITPLYLPVGL